MSENLNDALVNDVGTLEESVGDSENSNLVPILSTEETQIGNESEDGISKQENVDKTTINESSSEFEFESVKNLAPEKSELPDVTQEILASVRENRALLERLKEEFETKFKYDKNKETQIERLYQENHDYKNDLLWFLRKDLIADVVTEIDDIEKRLPYLRQKEATAENYAKALDYVEEITENFRLLLERYDVYSYRSADGAAFDPSRQRTLEVKATRDKTLDRTTVPIRRGFELDVDGKKRLVRKELVYVYKYDERLAVVSTEITETNDQTESTDAMTERTTLETVPNVQTE